MVRPQSGISLEILLGGWKSFPLSSVALITPRTSIPGKLAPPPDVTGSPSLGYEEGIRWGRHGSDSQIDL
ncbi:hypothetical protein BKA82DRAFT_35212 [Pisolithus tinctorius]|nr:hypothetical protein BKA82DRAFT_35212 [Pisolithus tinctorius]